MDDITQRNASDAGLNPPGSGSVPDAKPESASPVPKSGASQLDLTQLSSPVTPPMPYRPPVEATQMRNQPVAPSAKSMPPAAPVSPWPQAQRTQSSPAAVPPVRKAPVNNLALLVIAFTLVAGVGIVSVGAFFLTRLLNASHNDATNTPAVIAAAPTGTPLVTLPTATLGVDIQPWDGTQRFTILLMGLDKRPGEKGTAFRTDSMMLLSLDPTTKSIGILSVPRDLFVEIPRDTVVRQSYGLQRVNSAYAIGELVSPGYGAKLAMQTVQYNLGVRVNDYIVYEFDTVIKAVDAIGGIDIDVPYTINDPAYPNMYFGYEPLYIPAGHRHMDGALALKYARTRHQTSDFDRAKRQQQVITAMRDKILSLNMAPTLIAKAPELWGQVNASVRSGLTFDQLLRLALFAKDVSKDNIKQGVIDYNYVQPVNWNGADVLVPNRSAIGPLLVQIFGPNYNR